VNIPRLEDLSGKLRLVRNKTFFHIDKVRVSDSQAVYTEANIIAGEVIWAIETVWRTLNRLYEERFGRPYHQGHMTLGGMREIFRRDLANMREKGIVRK
jgi:DNA-binding GntR family transcriptional regulator